MYSSLVSAFFQSKLVEISIQIVPGYRFGAKKYWFFIFLVLKADIYFLLPGGITCYKCKSINKIIIPELIDLPNAYRHFQFGVIRYNCYLLSFPIWIIIFEISIARQMKCI